MATAISSAPVEARASFILSGYPPLEEAYRFAELVMPLLPLAHEGVAAAYPGREHGASQRGAAKLGPESDDQGGPAVTGNGPMPRVANVGGGFAGAAVATHLARRTPTALAVDVIEPRAMLGGGVAYSSLDPAHRTNVAAVRMSLFTDDAGHFMRWLTETHALEDDPEAVLPDGRVYPRRLVFGRYVADQVDRAARSGRATVRHLRDRAVEIGPRRGGWAIGLASGRTIVADIVILAVSHSPPNVPDTLLRTLSEHRGFVPDPWSLDALKPIFPMDTILIMGTALSMADAVASLELQGHRGPIVAFSRRGLLSRAHAASSHGPFGAFAHEPMPTASATLRRVRRAVLEAERLGLPWQSVVDAMRRDGQAVWQKLASVERARLLRHLKPYWEVHRYRVAPQIGAGSSGGGRTAAWRSAAGSTGSSRGRPDPHRVEPAWPSRQRQRRVIESDAFVLTTGPDHAGALRSNPALRSLAEAGHVQPDEFGLGLFVDRQHRAVPRVGLVSGSLLIAGPLARGTFGELMGLPRVAHDAQDVADVALTQVHADVAARPYLAIGALPVDDYVYLNTRLYDGRPISSNAAG